jgi:hypothetical protein
VAPGRDYEPEDVFREDVGRIYKRLRRRAIQTFRAWLTAKLAGILLGGVVGIALAILYLPGFAAALCGAVVILAAGYAVYARKLLKKEQRSRRWLEINALRRRQEVLQANNRVAVATLALNGDREAIRDSRSLPPELRSAILRIHQRVAQAENAARFPKPGQGEARGPALPEAPDLEPMKRRQKALSAELASVEAKIQALADPTDSEAPIRAQAAKEQSKRLDAAASEAEKLARERRMRGLKATMPAGGEQGLQIRFDPTGQRDVQRAAPQPTPEQIVREALDEPSP